MVRQKLRRLSQILSYENRSKKEVVLVALIVSVVFTNFFVIFSPDDASRFYNAGLTSTITIGLVICLIQVYRYKRRVKKSASVELKAKQSPYYYNNDKMHLSICLFLGLWFVAQGENQETEGMKDIITLPDYKIEIPNEKLIECMHMISLHKDNKIAKRELKDLALNRNLIQVGKKDTQDKEESDQAAYMSLNKNLIEPLMDWKFISVKKIGSRHIVSLTDEGINALRFLHEGK